MTNSGQKFAAEDIIDNTDHIHCAIEIENVRLWCIRPETAIGLAHRRQNRDGPLRIPYNIVAMSHVCLPKI